MPFPLKITMIENPPAELSARMAKEFQRQAFRAVAEYWFAHYLADHFQSYSGAKYGYQRRTARWLRRKRALAGAGIAKEGGLVDLVFTGDMRDVMRRVATIRAYPTRATLTMQAPRYVTFKPRGNQPNKMDEALRTIDSQRKKLDTVWRERFEQQVKNFKSVKRTEIQ